MMAADDGQRMMIRPATKQDVGRIQQIVEEAYSSYIERIGCKPAPMTDDHAALVASGAVWVLVSEDRIAGLIVLRVAPDHLLVSNVAVGKAYQGQGHGRKLLDHAEAFARKAGRSELRLYTNELMHENLAIYPRLGWKEYKRAEENGFRRVFLRKLLPLRTV